MQIFLIKTALICIICSLIGHVQIVYGEETIDQEKSLYLEKIFQGPPPEPGYLWIKPSIRPKIEAVIMHGYNGFRIKYWDKNEKTVWILEDIAKEKPVCVGIITYQEKIISLDIIFSNGKWGKQIQNINFINQFENVEIDEKGILNKNIDGISGATLSVNVVSRLAQLALLLDKIKYSNQVKIHPETIEGEFHQ